MTLNRSIKSFQQLRPAQLLCNLLPEPLALAAVEIVTGLSRALCIFDLFAGDDAEIGQLRPVKPKPSLRRSAE